MADAPTRPEPDVALRPTTREDLPFVLAQEAHADNAPYIVQWSRERHCEAIDRDTQAHLIAVDRAGTHLGYAILQGLRDEARGIEFTRVVVAEKGRGIGRRVVRRVKELAFDELGAHRLWLDVVQTNARARHLYRQEGFVEEGTLRESMLVAGARVSLVVLSMLRREHA